MLKKYGKKLLGEPRCRVGIGNKSHFHWGKGVEERRESRVVMQGKLMSGGEVSKPIGESIPAERVTKLISLTLRKEVRRGR